MRSLIPAIAVMLLSSCQNQSQSNTHKEDTTAMNKEFKPVEWSHTTNVYEVNIRQYTKEGTFNAFAKELPRLKDLGVTTLWFMPVTPIAQKNKKGPLGSYYAASDYTAINPEFGSLEDFKSLVKHAHEMGFKVIIDWVANHTGWDHKWTKEHPDYYEKDSVTHDFKIASGMDDIIELNFHNPQLVRAMIDAMKFWVKECDVDGFRCDLAFWVELDFWQKARHELESVKPLFWLGELDPLEHPEYMGTFDAAYTWTWMHKAEDYYKKHLPLTVLDSVLHQYDAIGDKSMRAWFTTNHDENSWNGTEYEKYGDMALPLAVFSCTWNGIPLIYSGQELPNRKRLKFFEKDPIEWTGSDQLHDFYKKLLALHATNSALRAGDPNAVTYKIKNSDSNHVLSYLRKNGSAEVLVILNLSSQAISRLNLDDENLVGSFSEVFTSEKRDFSTNKSFSLAPWQFLVFQK